MKQTQSVLLAARAWFSFCSALSGVGQINVGDYTISGGGEIGGLPRGFKGTCPRFISLVILTSVIASLSLV